MSDSLYNITEDFVALLESDEAWEDIEGSLEAVKDAFDSKVSNVCGYIEHLEDQASALKERKAKIAARQSALENKATRLRKYVLDSMTRAETMRVEVGARKVSLAKTPPKLEIADDAFIPTKFWINQAPKLDKIAVRDAIKGGEVIEGCKMVGGFRVKID